MCVCARPRVGATALGMRVTYFSAEHCCLRLRMSLLDKQTPVVTSQGNSCHGHLLRERSANLHAAAPGLAALCTAGPASSAAARFSPTSAPPLPRSPILGKAGAVTAVPRSFKGQPREGESHFKVVELSLQGGGREGDGTGGRLDSQGVPWAA